MALTLVLATSFGLLVTLAVVLVITIQVSVGQRNTFELLRAKWRDLEGTLLLHRDQQLAMISMRDLKFRWLLEHAAHRIVIDRGLNAFANPDWSEADTDSLRRAEPRYAELETFLEATNRRLATDPLLADAHERMLTLSSDKGYLRLSSRFRNRLRYLEGELTRSPSSQPAGSTDTPSHDS